MFRDIRPTVSIALLRKSRLALICCALCILVRPAGATSIVAIRKPGIIVVGADSAGSFEGRSLPSHTNPVCKIYQNDNIFFVVAGFVNDPVSHFSVPADILSTTKAKGTIRARADVAVRALRRKAVTEMAILEKADPAKYRSIASGQDGFVTVLIFGIEHADVVAIAFELKVVASSTGHLKTVVNWRSCPGIDCPKGDYIFLLGEHEAINQHFAAGKPISSNLVEAVNFLIGLEISDKPIGVQPPIDVLRLDVHGPQWIYHKKECPDIHP